MKSILTAAVFAASLAAGSAASAAIVVFTGGSPVVPANTELAYDINPNDDVTVNVGLNPGDSAEITFTALKALRVGTIAMSGVGNNSGLDLENVEFGYTSATTNVFSSVNVVPGGSASAVGFLPGGLMKAGDTFTIFWEDGIALPVSLSTSFSTYDVPVPAALPLLIGALGVLGVAGRRRKA